MTVLSEAAPSSIRFWCYFLGAVGVMSMQLVSGLSVVAGSPYCAYEVEVRKPDGTRFQGVPVGLVVNGTQRTTVWTDRRGGAQICDSPLHDVDIVVGFDTCGIVLVKNLKPTWPTARKVVVTYAQVPCEHFALPDRCTVLLRAQDDRGRPLSGAQFESEAKTPQISDAFGRVFLLLREGEKVDGTITKAEFGAKRFSHACVFPDVKDFEFTIVLTNQ